MNTKFKYQLITLFFIISMVCFGFVFYALGWDGPSSAPPGGNVDVPLNIGSTSQNKTGALGVQGIFRTYSNAYIDGNLGIGTTTPSEKLHVIGDILAVNGDVCQTTATVTTCLSTLASAGGDITGVTAGTGLTGGGTSGTVTLNADTSYMQRRVSSSCAAGSSIRAISSTGTVTCEPDDTGAGGGTPGGLDGQVQYNNGGVFGGASSINYNDSTGDLALSNDLSVTGLVAGGGLGVSGGALIATDAGYNVGIGTTTPSTKLDVAGDIHATGDICTDINGGVCLGSGPSIHFYWALQANGCEPGYLNTGITDDGDDAHDTNEDVFIGEPTVLCAKGITAVAWDDNSSCLNYPGYTSTQIRDDNDGSHELNESSISGADTWLCIEGISERKWFGSDNCAEGWYPTYIYDGDMDVHAFYEASHAVEESDIVFCVKP